MISKQWGSGHSLCLAASCGGFSQAYTEVYQPKLEGASYIEVLSHQSHSTYGSRMSNESGLALELSYYFKTANNMTLQKTLLEPINKPTFVYQVNGEMSPEFLSVIFAGVSSLAAVITAVIAAWSLTASRLDSGDRTRPVVIASLQGGPEHVKGIYLVLHNAGNSVAREVQVAFDPELPSYDRTDDGQKGVVAPVLRQRYASPIGIMAPGQKYKNLYHYPVLGKDGNAESVPDQFTVTVQYGDDRGRVYTDDFPLNVGHVGLETHRTPGKENDPISRQNKALEAIAWANWGR